MNKSIEKSLTAQLKELGQRLKAAREFRGLTLQALAKSAGIGMQTLVRIEDGSTGVGVLNLHKVLCQLGLPDSIIPPGIPGVSEPLLPVHLDSLDLKRALSNVVEETCSRLAAALNTGGAEQVMLGRDFQGVLQGHLEAMLCGTPAGTERPAKALKAIVYSNEFVGGPLVSAAANAKGWVLVSRPDNRVLQDGVLIEVGDDTLMPWDSRDHALAGFAAHVTRHGHVQGRVDAVPVFGVKGGKYRF